ncbi:hypothetical protein ACFL0O_00740 [Thermodesulfobacteriota bacterium]
MKIHHAFGKLMVFKFKPCPKGLSFFLFALLSEKKEEKISVPSVSRAKRAVKNMRSHILIVSHGPPA